ncbi:hypothetical protein GCK72_022389 [Caenorhabditis remanei]|uniref:Uncharacterized protein n=1 Tax=Caenorhabditis remanei TaxID=31234 RepID=A0A6A5FU79_CAERE|nr:hypothetical protein GCK72_022389 [Caenorhabditis remanei]KAF1745941.1 hypothetical protein GCK72_022389 [Caenorhabditis remanei]
MGLVPYKPSANRIAGAPTIKAEILRKFGENVQGNLFNPERLTFRLQETFIDFEGFPNLGGIVESQDEQVTNRGVQNTPNFDFGNIWVEIPPENWRIMRRKMERTKTIRILPQKKKKKKKTIKMLMARTTRILKVRWKSMMTWKSKIRSFATIGI